MIAVRQNKYTAAINLLNKMRTTAKFSDNDSAEKMNCKNYFKKLF